jgi:hypothetical protein
VLTGMTRTLAGDAPREEPIIDVRSLLGEAQPCDVFFRRNS